MYQDATAPDLGTGPFGVEKSEADGFYRITRDGVATVEHGGPYPIGNTAYKRARQLNNAAEGIAVIDRLLPPTPPVAKSRKAPVANPAPAPVAPAPKADPALILYQGTREEWLNAFVAAARPVFKQAGYGIPEKIRVTVGFPHNHRGGKVIGQCWAEAASGDGTREILVTPMLDNSSRIADVLTHELCHTLFGTDEKHGRNFAKAATALGLAGKPTATEAGPEWHEWADPILAKLGAIPHAALDPKFSSIKKQTTRLLKAECEDCGFTFRATAKWLSGVELQCPDVECGGVVRACVAEEG